MLSAQDHSDDITGTAGRALSREGLERRRLALREAVTLFRQHPVGEERLALLQRTEDELARVEAALRHPALRAM